MKTMKSLVSLSAALTTILAAVPVSASAADEVVYGTMDIPYTEFYAAELTTPVEVDAVTSATKSKALKNGEGELFEGSYNNGEDTILGVTYPVAIAQSDLDSLTDNYNFQPLEETPAAYKVVNVADGKVTGFSGVSDADPETLDATVNLSTETPWGDYLIEFAGLPDNFDTHYRGAVIHTTDGKTFAMRHEQNIWRGELAWSSGFVTEEPHGNKLDYKAYVDLMGSTIDKITLITADGYQFINTNTYVPVKFDGGVTVEDRENDVETTFVENGFPEDFKNKTYTSGEGIVIDAATYTLNYENAKPGPYTLTVSDNDGKYADVSTDFVIYRNQMPVVYDAAANKLVLAEGFTEEDLKNFIANINSVDVNGTAYATGRKGTTIVQNNPDEETYASIDFDVETRDGKVFADGAEGTYTITITSTGYTNPLVINLPADTTPTPDVTTPTDTPQAPISSSGTTAATTAAKTNGVATGDAGTGMAFAVLGLAGAAAVVLKKKAN